MVLQVEAVDNRFRCTAPATPQPCGVVACAVQGHCTCGDGLVNALRLLRVALRNVAANRVSLPLDQALVVAKELLVRTGDRSQGGLGTYFTDWDHFVAYAGRFGVSTPAGVDLKLVERWLAAVDSRQARPSVASQHRRRSSVRSLFECWRALDIVRPEHNPTSDLVLPPRSARILRPLELDEIVACRWASRDNGASTRYPAIWALAEAGATTTELTQVRRRHVDLANGRLRLCGTPRVRKRTVPLTDWGVDRLRDHLTKTSWTRDRHLVYGHEQLGTRLSTLSNAVITIYERAGLAGEPDIKAESVRAWVGRTMFDDGAPIEEVARRLGIRDLNKAMDLIGEDWDADDETWAEGDEWDEAE